jgi:alkylation response protein AidB-like acyl-CoA dehydrogenase
VTTHAPTTLLTDELLLRFHERVERSAPHGAHTHADLDELRTAGYLRVALPPAFGGPGLTLSEVGTEQRRLAYYAARVSSMVSAHLTWVGVAAELWRSGDRSLQWILEEAARDRLFTTAHVERGNEGYLLSSATRAERVDGGYRFTGYKSLGSLGGAWNFLGIHGVDLRDPKRPHIVHAFLSRNTEGVTVRESIDSGGPDGAPFDDALLDGAFIPDHFVHTLLAWELLLGGQIACGVARRALDVTVDALHRTTVAMQTRTMAADAEVQHQVARMGQTLEAIEPHVDSIATQWTSGTRHGARWPMKLLTARQHATDGAGQVIDAALDLVGGNGLYRHPELEHLASAARLARRHPATPRFTNGVVARTILSISADHDIG